MRELTQEEKETIYLSLLHLGVVSWTKSSRRMESAMQYVIQQESLSDMRILELYVDVARMTHCKWKAIERSLQYTLNSMWNGYGLECAKLFFHSATPVPKPTLYQFLFLYKREFENGNIKKWNDSIATPLDMATYEEHEESTWDDDDPNDDGSNDNASNDSMK